MTKATCIVWNTIQKSQYFNFNINIIQSSKYKKYNNYKTEDSIIKRTLTLLKNEVI